MKKIIILLTTLLVLQGCSSKENFSTEQLQKLTNSVMLSQLEKTEFDKKDNKLIVYTNEEVIKELLKTAQEITELYKNGQKLGLSQEELAFYDALTKPEHIKDFYQNDALINLTRELTEMLRKNRTIDWQKKETARASMRKMVKRLLKKYNYPPEDYDFAINTVISQCELWTDNSDVPVIKEKNNIYSFRLKEEVADMVAEDTILYNKK